mgnify:CR=1 FL=1
MELRLQADTGTSKRTVTSGSTGSEAAPGNICLLEFSHFNSSLAVQPDSCLSMLHTMYLWIPVVICVIITFIMSQMNVEKANEELKNSKMLETK